MSGRNSLTICVDEVRVAQIADVWLDRLAADLEPSGNALVERGDRHEALDAHLLVIAAPGEVVGDGDVVPRGGEVEGRRPSQVPVTA